ncbi:MAG: class I SAM-dependent methyltransferase [Betaproteobacteria bacterium]|nr:class I SAM-dependent methyltransferase [Betaproteobacteria bacterium]
MHESSKSIFHKIKDSRYATRYLVGHGIDIGAGNDSIAQYHEFFPFMMSCRSWDLPDGDAELMASVQDHSFDFVHSSHCLEHMRNAKNALHNWLRILKPGGHLICIIPDEDMYEQGVFPSTFNSDHKHTFTILKKKSWSKNSINVLEMLSEVKIPIEIKKIELLDATFRYQLNQQLGQPRFDQTLTPVGECGIEFVIKKLPA